MPPRKKAKAAPSAPAPAPASPSPSPVALDDAPGPSNSPLPHADADEEDAPAADDSKVSAEERLAKIAALRKRMAESAKANRRDLIAETTATRASAKNAAKLERKRKQAEAMGEKAEARETGEDLERKKNWEYSIEDNERWEKKMARKGRRADFSFTDFDDIARRKYKKDMDVFKPDLSTYNKQRAAAGATNTSSALIASSSSSSALAASEDLYRDANSFVYADHKPSDDAIDRVIGKINIDLDKRQKRSRERKNEVEGDITYINEKNKHFNKKLERYYDVHTQETRDNFERGTAL